MAHTIDARNVACPQPVILTQKALEGADEVTTIVDNEPARHNVSNLGRKLGCQVTVQQKDDGIYVTLRKADGRPSAAPGQAPATAPVATATVVFVASEYLGRGENQGLGSLLMQSFMNTLDALTTKPETMIFMNSGVKLVAKGSPVVESLRRLADQGVEILACGTCLSRYELMDEVGVGEVSNMQVIADTLMRAGKVIPL